MATDAAQAASLPRRVLINTTSNILGKVVTLGLGFAVTPLLVHQLGAVQYGLWMLVGSLVGYGSLLEFGIGSAVVKAVAEASTQGRNDHARAVIATALWLYTGLGLLAVTVITGGALLVPAIFNIDPNQHSLTIQLMILSGISVGLGIPCTAAPAVLRGLQRFDLLNVLGSTAALCSTAATLLVLFLGGDVRSIILINVGVMLASQAVMVATITRIKPALALGWRDAQRGLVRSIVAYSASTFVIHVAGRLQTQTDELVIGALLITSQITPYVLARRLAEIPQLLTEQFIKVLFPLAAEVHSTRNTARLQTLYITSTRLTLAVCLPLGCVLLVFGKQLLTIWVGPSYATYSALVSILTLAALIDMSQWPAGMILQGMARQRPLAICSLVAAGVNLGLSIALAPQLGLIGIALGTLLPAVGETFGFVLPYVLHVLGIRWRCALQKIIVPVLLPTILMIGSMLGMSYMFDADSLQVVFAAVALGMVAYTGSYLGWSASRYEQQLMWQAVAWMRERSLRDQHR